MASNSVFVRRIHYDIFNPLLTYFTAQFTDDYHVLYFFVGLIFGFFFSRNIWTILQKLNGNFKVGVAVIVLLLFFIVPPWSINGLRYWTASQIFIYGVLRYFNKEKKGLIFILFSILTHFSFILPVILLFASNFFLKNKFKLFFIIFVITLPLSILNIESFSNMLSPYMPSVFQQKFEVYTSDEIVKRVQESESKKSIFSMIYDYFRLSLMLLSSGFLFLKFNVLKTQLSPNMRNLLSFSLFFLVILNVIGFVPSIYRFYFIPFFLLMSAFLIIYQNYALKNTKLLIYAISVLCFLFCFGSVRYAIGSGLTGLSYIYKSPLYLLLSPFM